MSLDLTHLEENWQGREGLAAVFWPKANVQFFKWPEQADELRQAARAINQQENVYVSWCLFREAARKADNAAVVPGLLFDVDLNSGNHAANDYPDTEAEALELVQKSGLPSPTRVIHSGGGLYLHYLFDQPFEIHNDDDRKRIEAVLKGTYRKMNQTFTMAGRRIDAVFDLARVTRMIGTSNRKYGPDVMVTTLSDGGPRSRIEDLEALIGSGALKGSAHRGGSKIAIAPEGQGKGDFELVEENCAFARYLTEQAGSVTEPEWYALATIAAHCANGEDRFHAISALDARRYDEGETARKLRHAATVKPRTCASIEADLGFDGCKTCPFKASAIQSPYGLAFGNADLLRLQSEYVLTGDTDQYFCVVRDEPPLARQSFDNQFAHVVRSPHASFIKDKRSPKVKVVDYVPGEGRLILGEQTKILNRWSGGGVSPKEGDCSIILEHFNYLLSRQNERNWVLDYMSHLLQKPNVKIKHGIMLIGDHGVGKSFLMELLNGFFGSRNVYVDDAQIHASDNRAPLGNAQLLVLEEMATSNKWEVTNSFKPWFTADKVKASDKYVRSHDVRTPRGIFVFTNHAVPASFEKGERRNAVFRADAPPPDQTYFDRLWGEGLAQLPQFIAFLLKRDITAWSPNARPPMTDAKEEIILASRTPAAAEVDQLIQTKIKKDLVTLDELLLALNSPAGGPIYHRTQLRKAMHELGFRKLDRTKLFDGKMVDLWAVRDVPSWLKADHARRKAHYEGRLTPTGTTLGVIGNAIAFAHASVDRLH